MADNVPVYCFTTSSTGSQNRDYQYSSLGDAFVFQIGNLEKSVQNILRDKLRELRDRLWDVIKDGTTYFIEGDGHTIDQFNHGDENGLRHPYAQSNPWFQSLGHNVPEAIHIQRSQGHDESIFDSLAKNDDPDNFRYQIIFTSADAIQIFNWLRFGTSTMVPRDLTGRIYSDYSNKFLLELRRDVSSKIAGVVRGSAKL